MFRLKIRYPSLFFSDRTAVTGLEYALLAALVIVGIITGAGVFGAHAGASLTAAAGKYQAATNGSGSSAIGIAGTAPAPADGGAPSGQTGAVTVVRAN